VVRGWSQWEREVESRGGGGWLREVDEEEEEDGGLGIRKDGGGFS